MWQKVLEVEKVGVRDNFFEFGGHSLKILKLASEFRKLGLHIEVKDFFKYQTIEQQSIFIETYLKLLDTTSEQKFVIPIQPEGNNIPLFAFPEYLPYSDIGKHISKNQPLYPIGPTPFKTVKETANYYISEIKKIYPHGPYILIGFCYGAKEVVEMAQTLIAQGDEVPVLVLIEYYSPKIKISRASLKFLRPKTKFIISKLRGNLSLFNKGKFLFKELLYALNHINKKMVRSNSKNKGSINTTYSGKVILFQASQAYGYRDDSHMGWSELFSGEVKRYIIEGDHLAVMSGTAAAQIAEILNSVLISTNTEKKKN
jgi:thioesterase domain-containing protein/aryl carrier-like protein